MQPFFSVVIPLYNKEKSIVSTLDSVLQQSFTDFEIIIVNDGSTDNSQKAVEHYIESLQSNQNIRLINKKNGGSASARNLGIMESKGQYIALIDADDLWLEHYLSTQAALIRDFPGKSLYYTGYSAVGANGVEWRMGENNQIIRGEMNPWKCPVKPWTTTVVFTKEDALTAGLFDEKLIRSQDIDMWWRLTLLRGVAVDSTDCAIYRLAAENRISGRVVPIDRYIISKIPYYREYRERNLDFRRYFDNEMAERLVFYLRRPKYHFQARQLANQLDISILSRDRRLRLCFPIGSYMLGMFKRFINNEPLLLRNRKKVSSHLNTY